MIFLLPLIAVLSLGNETFNLEIASTKEERNQGLMNRPTLDKNAGMIFPIPENEHSTSFPCMWMENTLISLDMLFIGKDGKILDIIENVPPNTRDSRCPKNVSEPIAYVFELLGGACGRAGLQKGKKIDLSKL